MRMFHVRALMLLQSRLVHFSKYWLYYVPKPATAITFGLAQVPRYRVLG
jgi:hypothetical protein